MDSLTTLMGLANAALQADQSAIDTVSRNVANQSTAGYTRETAVFSNDSVSLTGHELGVTETAVSQRDRVLEQRLQVNTSTSSAAAARSAALTDVQNAFGLTSTSGDAASTQLGTALSSFATALTTLTASPTDATTRTAAVSAASALVSAFHDAATAISTQTTSLNADITTSAGQINSLTQQVAKLNATITAQDPNTDAGALEDQRQQAILQLSQLVGVTQQTTESNGVTLLASDGTVLVSGSTAEQVNATAVGGNAQLAVGTPPVTVGDWTGGTIGGDFEARDADLPQFKAQLDALAYGVASAVNAANQGGQTPSGSAGGSVFLLPTSATDAATDIGLALTSSDGLATAAVGEGAGGSGNAVALANVATAATVNGSTASAAFAAFIGELGNSVAGATSASSAATAATTQAQTQRDSLSGVSLDDEATLLTQYQRSYQAAAKVFAIVNDLLAAAINLGTETAVS